MYAQGATVLFFEAVTWNAGSFCLRSLCTPAGKGRFYLRLPQLRLLFAQREANERTVGARYREVSWNVAKARV